MMTCRHLFCPTLVLPSSLLLLEGRPLVLFPPTFPPTVKCFNMAGTFFVSLPSAVQPQTFGPCLLLMGSPSYMLLFMTGWSPSLLLALLLQGFCHCYSQSNKKSMDVRGPDGSWGLYAPNGN